MFYQALSESMPFKFGLNKSLPIWLFFLSSLALSFVDAAFFKVEYSAYVNDARIEAVGKGTSCKVTVTIDNVFDSRNLVDDVCKVVQKGQTITLFKTELLENWVAIATKSTDEVINSVEEAQALDWLLFLLLLALPILSRFSLNKDLSYIYYSGLLFVTLYSGYLWLGVLKT